MLRLSAGQAECLWDEALPVEVRELPRDLAALDRLLSDPGLLSPIVERFRQEVLESGRSVLSDGRPTIAMESFIRLMVLKARYRWGYRTLAAEVSDSIHLRRFCRISLSERVPDESTVRKLTRRIGPETVSEFRVSQVRGSDLNVGGIDGREHEGRNLGERCDNGVIGHAREHTCANQSVCSNKSDLYWTKSSGLSRGWVQCRFARDPSAC